MVKQSKLIKETIMYSVHKQTGDILTHHLPWEKGNVQLERYEKKGFTYERPAEMITIAETQVPENNSNPVEVAKIKRKYRKKAKA